MVHQGKLAQPLGALIWLVFTKIKNKARTSEYEGHEARYGAKDLESRYEDYVNSYEETQRETWKAEIWLKRNEEIMRGLFINKILLIKEFLAFCDYFCPLISKEKIFLTVYTLV